MSRTAAILERNFPAASEPSPAPPHAVAPRRRPYAELAARLFPRPEARGAFAFASVHKGEGVSTVVRGLAAELAIETEQILGAPSVFDAAVRSAPVVVDCGSLDESTDLLRLAPKVEGVVLVVAAGATEKEQVERAAQLIREAGGKLLGVVLNKRRYPVPNWLYRHL